MLSLYRSNNNDNDSTTIDLLYRLCKENEIEKVRNCLQFIHNKNIINKIHASTHSTCLHVACYYGHREIVYMLLEYGALRSVRNLTYDLTAYEEADTDDIKQLFLEKKLFSNNDYDYIEWSMVGDNLLDKQREFRQKIDLYKNYDNQHLISKLLVEIIHYYLNEYLINESNDNDNSEDQITRQQIETIEACFKEAIEKQDYLTYFIKAYTLSTRFFKELNKHLALYVLEYFDRTKYFSPNYRLVNCLIHIVTLLIHHPNLSQYRFQGACYRGMRITQHDLEQYKLDQHILNRSFLSASIDREIAEMFAGEGQQSHMRHTYQNHRFLQYSCLCKYLIKQNSTAINIENLSMNQHEKEILILPFSVFKVVKIKRNDFDSTNTISIEIELEECEDSDNNSESENIEELRTNSFLSSCDDIRDRREYLKLQRRKYLLYGIIGFLLLVFFSGLIFTFIFTFVIKKNTATNTTMSTKENDIDVDDSLPLGCPNILNRSSWNARPSRGHDNLKTFPVTHIVIRPINDSYSPRNQQDCIKQIIRFQHYHMYTLGWSDIGYNFIICNDNHDQQEIYEGRGWKYIGAHCRDYNNRSLGIGIVGNYISVKSMNIFKSLIECGIIKNAIKKTFTLVGDSEFRDIYEYYLNYFGNDTNFQYNNKASNEWVFC
ncbi:unnamed protein product [Rotaria sordida]|uniref:NAD(P)(+)--arginine ADP-ribosyltransferase n=1 Tax=Rotaria sordida TaxID=392033 RepID=A0A815M468_9BILA|nr:unnamed protein product [Rotaria sordida]CAF1629181.1 unnamed protein product [Rotaria sordida]